MSEIETNQCPPPADTTEMETDQCSSHVSEVLNVVNLVGAECSGTQSSTSTSSDPADTMEMETDQCSSHVSEVLNVVNLVGAECSGTQSSTSTSSDPDIPLSADEIFLSEHIKGACPYIKRLADAWIKIYESSQLEASRAILELILHSTGIKDSLDKDQVLNLNYLTICRRDVEPLISYKVFTKNLLEFLELTLTDEILSHSIMRRIYDLLKVMMKSACGCARFTAFVIGSEITHLYMKYTLKLNTVGGLDKKSADEKRRKLNGTESIVNRFFKDYLEFLISSLRELVLKTRQLAVRLFGNWCLHYHDLLGTDVYLCHVHRALFDENPTIRCEAVKACNGLLTSNCFMTNNKWFVEKTLLALFVRMNDDDSSVRSLAEQTVMDVFREFPYSFRHFSVNEICNLLYKKKPVLATEATGFLHIKLLLLSRNSSLQYIWAVIVFIEKSKSLLGDAYTVKTVVDVLIRNLFKHSFLQLSDWGAWTKLLLKGTIIGRERLQVIAYLVLFKVIKCLYLKTGLISYIHFKQFLRSAPPSDENQTACNGEEGKVSTERDETLKNKFLNYLEQITLHFGPEIVEILHSAKNNKTCLKLAMMIPQHFTTEIENLDMRTISCYLMSLKILDTESLSIKYSCLKHVYRLMRLSPKWIHHVPRFEDVLLKVVKEFKNACHRLAEHPPSPSVKLYNVAALKEAYYLSQCINMTKTPLFENSLDALRFGRAKQIPEIICPAAKMCLYMLIWHLSELLGLDRSEDESECLKQSEDELKCRLYKMQSYLRTLLIQLEDLIQSENFRVKETSFYLLCTLHCLFCPWTQLRDYPIIHLQRPSDVTTKWLTRVLGCLAPVDDIPADGNHFRTATCALDMFGTLLFTKILDMSYISSILPYFRFYQDKKNYNQVLESTVQKLAARHLFHQHLIQSLVVVNERVNHIDLVKVTEGLCSVVLAKLKPVSVLNALAGDIIEYAMVNKITKEKNYYLFPAMLPFARLLSKKHSAELFDFVMDNYHEYLEEAKYVKHFLAEMSLIAFGKRMSFPDAYDAEQPSTSNQ